MTEESTPTVATFRAAIEHFLQERLTDKLDKLADDVGKGTVLEREAAKKREALQTRYSRNVWIANAAERVGNITLATHIAKATHPSSKGSSLYCLPSSLFARNVIGTHSIGGQFTSDAAVSDAKHLDVYAFLQIPIDGRPLLEYVLAGNKSLRNALSDSPSQQTSLIASFGKVASENQTPVSSNLTKQVYWLKDHNARDDNHYHLLAPLYASSLAHAVFRTIETDRFGEAGKEARQARKDNLESATGFNEHPNLVIQKLGGSNQQNVSRLNKSRKGNNYLLASLPPSWKSRAIRRPWRIDSVFTRLFGAREEVRNLVRKLRDFLLSKPPANMHTRNHIERALDGLIGELVMFASGLQTGLPAGWSQDSECELVEVECLWLDPGRAEHDETFNQQWQRMDWPDEIGKRFGNWLNAQLGPELPLGDAEQRQWRRELLFDEEESGWASQLHQHRKQLDAPTYIPTRGAVP